jgi:hypothetical protein
MGQGLAQLVVCWSSTQWIWFEFMTRPMMDSTFHPLPQCTSPHCLWSLAVLISFCSAKIKGLKHQFIQSLFCIIYKLLLHNVKVWSFCFRKRKPKTVEKIMQVKMTRWLPTNGMQLNLSDNYCQCFNQVSFCQPVSGIFSGIMEY